MDQARDRVPPARLRLSAGNTAAQGIDLTVERGETIALIGPSGSGKTTLVSLLQRLYPLTEGSISIDGVDIRTMTQRSLRAQIGVVFQEPHLFNDTVRANIAYGRPEATHDRIESAARAAQAHDFIMALPKAYDTIVRERGNRLSGGQRQRVAIARTLLKDPPILILDEATSALDAESERLIQLALTASCTSAPRSSSRTGWRRCEGPIASWWWRTVGSPRWEATPS